MSLTTAASTPYPTHPRAHQHAHQQPPYPYSYSHRSDDESSPNNHSPRGTSPVEPSHPLYISTSGHHHHQQSQPQQPYHHTPYQVPSPPYSHPHPRSNSIELTQKPILPYPTPRHHPYSPPAHRSHPYSPPTLPPLTGRPPLSPQSPVEPAPQYSTSSEDRHHYRNGSSMSLSPPPSSANGSNPAEPALSASDRRERNKAASAKYRAKKHHQSGEMRTQITALQDQNNLVTRQLEECRAENALLKSQVEKLKGRLVAEKVLKRLREAGREKKRSHQTTKVSAQDLTVSDSETDNVVKAVHDAEDEDDEDDDVDDSILDDDIDDDDNDEDFDIEIAKLQKQKKSNTRRKVARTGHDDQDYCGN